MDLSQIQNKTWQFDKKMTSNRIVEKFGNYTYELEHLSTPDKLHTCKATLYQEAEEPDSARKEIFTFNRDGRAKGGFFIKNGQTWFWSGRDYYSQLFVNLATGEVFEQTATGPASKFIWCDVNISLNGQVLAVEGCEWAARYEILFFDFSDPSVGWPNIKPMYDRLPNPPKYRFLELDEYSKWEWKIQDDGRHAFIYWEEVIWDNFLKIACDPDQPNPKSRIIDLAEIVWYKIKFCIEPKPDGRSFELVVDDLYIAPENEGMQ